jgi:hypothetical protein
MLFRVINAFHRSIVPAVTVTVLNSSRDRSAARASLEHVLSWPAERVLMAHGTPVSEDGRAFIGRAFRWLTVGLRCIE